MASLEEVRAVLGELGRAYGVGALALDDVGDCSLMVDGRLPVDFHYDEAAQSLVLESEIGRLPSIRPEPVLETVAQGNRLGIETLGGTLALGPDNQILLMRELSHAELPLTTLERALQEQVDAALAWQGRLAGGPAPSVNNVEPIAPLRELFDPTRLV